jgi:hypothetical protein
MSMIEFLKLEVELFMHSWFHNIVLYSDTLTFPLVFNATLFNFVLIIKTCWGMFRPNLSIISQCS